MPNSPTPSRLFITTENAKVSDDLVLLNSGALTRNRDFWSGKSLRVVPDGIRTANFDRNPLILYMHNDMIPLGQSRVFKSEGKLWGDRVKFHRQVIPIAPGWMEGMTAFDTSVIADLWEGNWIKGASVRIDFSDEDYGNIVETEEEIVLATSDLVEWTICTLPADAESVKQRFAALGVDPRFASFIPTLPETERVPELVVVRPPNLILPKEYRMNETTDTGPVEIPVSQEDVAAFAGVTIDHILSNQELLTRFAAAIRPHLNIPTTQEMPQAFRLSLPKPVAQTETPVAQTPEQTPAAPVSVQRQGRLLLSGQAFKK